MSNKIEEKLYGELYGLLYFFIDEMSGGKGEEEIRKVCKSIYNNRKKIGLFTLDDIEIDEGKAKKIVADVLPNTSLIATEPKYIKQWVKAISKAIAKENIIKVK